MNLIIVAQYLIFQTNLLLFLAKIQLSAFRYRQCKNRIIICYLQVCASYQVTLEYIFKPTFTKEDIHLMATVTGDGLTTLNISLPNVKFNEHYKVTVGVNGTDVFMYSQSLSKCSEYKSVT